MVAYTRRQVIDHIHRLSVIQLERTGSIHARCVIRDGQIRLIAHRCAQPADLVIIAHVTSPDIVPLRTVIHQGVDENWNTLNSITITL